MAKTADPASYAANAAEDLYPRRQIATFAGADPRASETERGVSLGSNVIQLELSWSAFLLISFGEHKPAYRALRKYL
jgi:hypothetical protein